MKRSGPLLAAIGMILSSCVVVDEGPGPRPYPPYTPPPQQDYCTREYRPVCGGRGDNRLTFANACEAKSRGFAILYGGRCGTREPGIPRPTRPKPFKPVACPEIYAPVCARRGSMVRDFPNACVARGSGYRVIDNGPC